MTKRCAFLSMNGLDDFVVYDELTFAPLAARGWAVDTVPWRNAAHWSDYDVVVIRSTWDYQAHADEFLGVLERISAETRLENPLEVVRWNIDKTYLRSLAEQGVAIVPTLWFDTWAGVENSFGALGTEEIVVKPVVSANADDTYRIREPDFDTLAARISPRFSARRFMVQPFLSSVVERGERSLFYFSGQYSHAVTKTPKRGDFRVQEEHGGTIEPYDAPADLRAQAKAAIAAVGNPLLYARADFVHDGTQEALIELELIEPSLYFEQDAEAPTRFAAALDLKFG